MKILHVMSCGISSGAGRGAYWLHQAQRKMGIESNMLISSPDDNEDVNVKSLAKSRMQRFKFSLISKLGKIFTRIYRNRKKWTFNTGFEGVDITRHPLFKSADIIHLHWVNGLIKVSDIRKIKKPVVWTMRDMWPLTGGCHYSMGCVRYKVGCGRCPQLGSNMPYDLSWLVMKNKERSFHDNMALVGISRWVTDCAKESRLFSGYDISTISNNINTKEFYPVDQNFSRIALGLPIDKKMVLIGARSIKSFYKGFDLFVQSLRNLDVTEMHFVFFGDIDDSTLSSLEIDYTNLGYLCDSISLRLVYSAVDMFVATSRMEAFGKTLAESMACGTPVVCFDATGPKDIVEHKVTGYKAVPYEPSDLAAGIKWLLDRSIDETKLISDQARSRAARLFDSEVIAKQYIEIYKKILLDHTLTE